MNVIAIFRTPNIFLGVARNYRSALHYLTKTGTITGDTKLNSNDGEYPWLTVGDCFGENWESYVASLSVNEFNELFGGTVHLDKTHLIEELE